MSEFVRVRFPDARPVYPFVCRVLNHRWQRVPYTWPQVWERPRSCRCCRHIAHPDCREEWRP